MQDFLTLKLTQHYSIQTLLNTQWWKIVRNSLIQLFHAFQGFGHENLLPFRYFVRAKNSLEKVSKSQVSNRIQKLFLSNLAKRVTYLLKYVRRMFFLCSVHYWKNAIDLKVFAPNDDDYPCKSFFDDQLQFLLFVLLIWQNCKKRLDVVFVEVRCSSIKLARGQGYNRHFCIIAQSSQKALITKIGNVTSFGREKRHLVFFVHGTSLMFFDP